MVVGFGANLDSSSNSSGCGLLSGLFQEVKTDMIKRLKQWLNILRFSRKRYTEQEKSEIRQKAKNRL